MAKRNRSAPERRQAQAARGSPPVGQKTRSPRFSPSGTARPIDGSYLWARTQRDALKYLGPYTPVDVPMWQRKLIRRDPQVSLGMQARKAPFFGIDYRLEGSSAEIRAFVRKAFLDTPLWNKWMNSALNALDFGYSPHEVVWRRGVLETDDDGPGGLTPKRYPRAWMIQKLEDLDPELVELWIDDTRALTGLRWLDSGMPSVFGPLLSTDDKAIVVTHEAEHQNWLGQSILDRVFNPWYWWNWIHLYMVRYLERKADPPTLAWAPPDQRQDPEDEQNTEGDDNMLLMGERLAELRGSGVAVVPFELIDGKLAFDAKVLEDGGRLDQFLPALQHLGDLILRGLGVPERIVTQNSTVGSFAMVAAQADVYWASLQRDLIELLNATTLGPIAFLVRANFGADAPVPMLRASELSRQARETTAKMLELAWAQPYVTPDGKLYTAGMLFDPRRALEALNQPHASPAQVAREAGDPFLERVMKPAGAAPTQMSVGQASEVEAPSDAIAADAVPADVGLNGAQVTAAAELLGQVARGDLPADAVRPLLVAIGITEDRVDQMLSALDGFASSAPAGTQPAPRAPQEVTT